MSYDWKRDVKWRPGFQDRREKRDFWSRSITWFTLAGWVIMVSVLVIFDKAKPTQESFFDRFHHVERVTTWNDSLVQSLFIMMIVGFLLGIVGLIINYRRNRRQKDHISVSLILLSLVSLLGILIFLLN
ncbi:MAG: hypothetical protein K8S56_07590 [Candidatus Cloacimonetes bacterium]|nr:hypothetical protein [Candidatus Cloacimonadota bacterium]